MADEDNLLAGKTLPTDPLPSAGENANNNESVEGGASERDEASSTNGGLTDDSTCSAEHGETRGGNDETDTATGTKNSDTKDEDDPRFNKGGFEEEETGEAQLPQGALDKTGRVFLPWPGLVKECDQISKKAARVVLFDGDTDSGRFTTAVWAGLRFLKNSSTSGRIIPVTETIRMGGELVNWLRSSKRQKESVYIIQQPAGEKTVLSAISEESVISIVNTRLRHLESWLVVIAKKGEVPPLNTHIARIEIPAFDAAYLIEVTGKHLDLLGEREPGWQLDGERKRIISAMETVIKRVLPLPTPSHIVRMIGQLPDLFKKGIPDDKALIDFLEATAKAVASGLVQAWFAGLKPNGQFLALLVEAFRGTRQESVETIYCEQARRLSRGGSGIEDPRRFGFDDLYHAIHAQSSVRVIPAKDGSEMEFQHLEFEHESYRREVLRQMRSRHHLLWDVMMPVLNRGLKNLMGYWQAPQRQALGEIIARLGIHRPDDLQSVLEDLATSDFNTTASIPGYVLRGVCLLDEPNLQFVGNLIKKWAMSEDHMWWAAASAIWRVIAELGHQLTQLDEKDSIQNGEGSRSRDGYRSQLDILVANLENSISLIAKKLSDVKSADSDFISFTIERMFRALPERTGKLIQRWLTPSGVDFHAAGERAARRLFSKNEDPELLTANHFKSLLELLGAILRLKRYIVDEVLQTVLHWTQCIEEWSLGSEEWQKRSEDWYYQIAEALLKTCNRADDSEREHLRRALTAIWLRAGSLKARHIADMVIGRARLLDGAATDVLGGRSAVLLIDGSKDARYNDTAARLTQEFFEFLKPQVDLWVLQMGHRGALTSPGRRLKIEKMASRMETSRIVMPWLERFQIRSQKGGQKSQLHFALALHWGNLVDAEDADDLQEVPFVPVPVPGHHLSEDKDADDLLPQPERGWEVIMWATFEVLRQHAHQEKKKQNEQASEGFLLHQETVVGAYMSRNLVTRTVDEWWDLLGKPLEGLAMEISLEGNRHVMAKAALDTVVARLDAISLGRNRSDPMRVGLGLIQWMAAQDFDGTIAFLCQWMRGELQSLRVRFAAAASTMLLRIQFYRMIPLLDGTTDPPSEHAFLSVLRLAMPLARCWRVDAMGLLLHALRWWVRDESQAAALKDDGSLLQMVDKAPRPLLYQLMRGLDAITSEPITALKEKTVPWAAQAFRLRLQCAIATRVHMQFKNKLGILVLFHSSSGANATGRVHHLASQLFRLYEAQRVNDVDLSPVMFFRAGHRHPVAIGGEGFQFSENAFQALDKGFGILAPTLESFGSAASHILILADAPLLDANEWLDTFAAEPSRASLFWDCRHTPAPSQHPAWMELFQDTSEKEALARILKYLKPHISNRAS